MQPILPIVERETVGPARVVVSVASSINTLFVKRAAGLIGLGLLNLLVICLLGLVLFFLPDRTYWDFWLREFVRIPTSSLLLALVLLLACVLVLAKQQLAYRLLGGFVALSFMAMVLSVPGPGFAVGVEHFIAFWLCLVTLIPLRVLFSWSIHWSDEPPRTSRTGQFAIADFLSWTAAIAVTLACSRVLFMGSSAWTLLPDALGAIGASSVVVIPCAWLAFSRVNRVRGSLWITLWVLGVSIFWIVLLLVWDYCVQRYSWQHIILLSTRDAVFLLLLEISLLGNIFALEWLGMRWSRAPIRTPAAAFE
jgi:hypothetical protein